MAPGVAAPESADEVSDIIGILLAADGEVATMVMVGIGTSRVVVIV
jgi:hypothetical protein